MDIHKGSKGGLPELYGLKHCIVPVVALALCAAALIVIAASPIVFMPVEVSWK